MIEHGDGNGRWRPVVGLVLALVLLLPAAALAQEAPNTGDRFQRARSLAFEGKRDLAKELSRDILSARPDHYDTRVLLGRLHAWDHEYDLAREQFRIVLEARPDYTDARSALIDVELWSDHPEAALEQAETGLRHDPGHAGLLYKKARAQRELGRTEETQTTLETLVERHPEHTDGRTMLRQVEKRTGEVRVGADYEFTHFDSFDDPWQEVSVEVGGQGEVGSLTGRVNMARRFGRDGIQFEIDAYPSLADGVYAYLNFGYSPDDFFPEIRYGGELYSSLPNAFEVSAGFRRLQFDSTDVTIWTGSVGKYFGNYWLSVRPYITPKDEGTSVSGHVSLRRYFSGRYDYVGFTVSAGSKPDDTLTTLDLARLDSYAVRFEGKKPVARGLILEWAAGYQREEFPFDRIRNRVNARVGFQTVF